MRAPKAVVIGLLWVVATACEMDNGLPSGEKRCQRDSDCPEAWSCEYDENDPLRSDRHGYFCVQTCGLGLEPCPSDRRCEDRLCMPGDGTPGVLIDVPSCFAGKTCLVTVYVSFGSGRIDAIEVDFGDGSGQSFDSSAEELQQDSEGALLYVDHVFAEPGLHTVTAIAHDANGLDGHDEYAVDIRAPF